MDAEAFERSKSLWDRVIRQAIEHKYEVFDRDAQDAARFYGEAQDFMYTPAYNGETVSSGPLGPGGYYRNVKHRMSSNLVFNLVEAFLPALYSKDPVRTVTARRPKVPDQLVQWLGQYDIEEKLSKFMALPIVQSNPQLAQGLQQMAQQQVQQVPAPQSHDVSVGSPGQPRPAKEDVVSQIRAGLMEWVLNQSIQVTDLKANSREGIVDGLVKGRGLLMADVLEWGDCRIPMSRYKNVDDLIYDPDVKNIKDAKWIGIKHLEPVWKVEGEWGWPAGTLKATYESYVQQASIDLSATGTYDRESHGMTCDLIEYYEIFSRIGVGSFLKDADDDLHAWLDSFGSNVRLLISHDRSMPLNLPDWIFDQSGSPESSPPTSAQVFNDIAHRLSWPLPTYSRPGQNPWPIAVLDFHRQLEQSWPIAHVTPSLGFVKCINWIFSYLMGRVRHASRTFLVVPKNLEEEVKDALLHGSDLELLEIESKHPGTLKMVADFIQIPNCTGEIWELAAALKQAFEESTGVTQLLTMGETEHAFRSAAEANIKQEATQTRPGDMANTVEDWMAEAARIEAFAWLHLAQPQDVAPIFGEQFVPAQEQYGENGEPIETQPQMGKYTRLWMLTVASEDPSSLYAAFDFDIESGSAEKKNRQHQIAVAQQTMQMFFPVLFQYYTATGDSTQINAAVRQWAMAIEHPDPDELMFPDMRQQRQQQQEQAQEMASYNLQHREAEQQGRHPEPQPSGQPQIPPQLAQFMGPLQQQPQMQGA